MSQFHVSPSQIDKFLHCQRSWGARYIAELPEPPNKYAQRGTAVHKVLEDWIVSAVPPNLDTLYGRIAYPALIHIPAPGTKGLLPERKVGWEIDGVLWNFIKDLELPGFNTHIWDYKTTSNLQKAQKSPEQLLSTDPAGIVYAAHAFLVHGAQTVRLEWLYLLDPPTRTCHPVIVDVDRKHCLERFEWLQSVARVMLGHRERRTDWRTLAPGPAYCNAFGGCPHRALCNLSPIDEFRSMLEMSNEQTTVKPVNSAGFLAAISKFAQGGAPAAPAQPATPAPLPREALVAAAEVVYSGPPSPHDARDAMAGARETVVVEDPPAKLMPWQKVVQAAPQPTPAPAEDPTPTIPDLVVPGSVASQQETAKPKRTRRTKAEMAAARAAQGLAPQSEAEQEAELDKADEQPKPSQIENPPELSQEELDARKARTMAETWGVSAKACQGACVDRMLLEQVVIAMAGNPGYASLQSVDIVDKARAIVAAIEVG